LADVRARMTALGMSVDFRSSDQFRELIAGEYKKYGVVVRDADIQPN
jgi:tripartite-type tricarboxylate transporter receptor subunit TctC